MPFPVYAHPYFDITTGNNFDGEKVHEGDIFERQDILRLFARKSIKIIRISKIPKHEAWNLVNLNKNN